MARKRVGILAGTFDPVHAGHLAFALEASKVAKLDRVCFLPERQPRGKSGVEHFGHRTAMLTRAIRPHKNLCVLELPDMYFDVKRTLPKLQREFAHSELVFLMGSDTFLRMNPQNWPTDDMRSFLEQTGLIIGLRAGQKQEDVEAAIKVLPCQPTSLHILNLPDKHISSSRIRHAFRHDLPIDGMLTSVRRYARDHWLYVSLSRE